MYVLDLCGFYLLVRFRFRSFLIAKTAVSVFFGFGFLTNNCFSFDQKYRQINIFLLLGQHNAFISLTIRLHGNDGTLYKNVLI